MNKEMITIFIIILLSTITVISVIAVISYPTPLYRLYNWTTKTEPFRLLTDDESRHPEIFYLSPHTVAGDVFEMEETEQRTGVVDDLSDIPALFQQLTWTPINEDYEMFSSMRGSGVSGKQGTFWEGKMSFWKSKQEKRDKYNQFIEYYAREFYNRGWDWSIDLTEDEYMSIGMGSSGLSRTFITRQWGYVARKGDIVRFVSFRFDKTNWRFIIFLSDEVPLVEVLEKIAH